MAACQARAAWHGCLEIQGGSRSSDTIGKEIQNLKGINATPETLTPDLAGSACQENL